MQAALRIFAVLVILIFTTIAWSILGTNMGFRTDRAAEQLTEDVVELWGRPLQQGPPSMALVWEEEELMEQEIYDSTLRRNFKEKKLVKTPHQETLLPASSDVRADIRLDPRRRGLLWFALYDVDFHAEYAFINHTERAENAEIRFEFPTKDGVYDNFRVLVDGKDVAAAIGSGGPLARLAVTPGQEVKIVVGYRSRGLNSWSYQPNQGVGVVENLHIDLTTDFDAIDYPPGTLSPTEKQQTDAGWNLTWEFQRLVTGAGMGMLMPQRIQPGELAEKLAFSAPVSLALFFLMLAVLSLRQNLPLHPMHYAFIAAGFFAFPLLFAYLADHLSVKLAFAIASATSLALVVSYMRLVVSNKFAFGPITIAQGFYQVGFALAHFWQGFTGLTVTVLGIMTLFVIMQLTAKQDWNKTFTTKKPVYT